MSEYSNGGLVPKRSITHAVPCRCWRSPEFGFILSAECIRAHADSPNGKAALSALNAPPTQDPEGRALVQAIHDRKATDAPN